MINKNMKLSAGKQVVGSFAVGQYSANVGGNKALDIGMLGFEASIILAASATTIAAEFVDEQKVESLNKAALALNSIGLVTGFLSVGTGIRQAAKKRVGAYDVTAHATDIPMRDMGPREAINCISRDLI